MCVLVSKWTKILVASLKWRFMAVARAAMTPMSLPPALWFSSSVSPPLRVNPLPLREEYKASFFFSLSQVVERSGFNSLIVNIRGVFLTVLYLVTVCGGVWGAIWFPVHSSRTGASGGVSIQLRWSFNLVAAEVLWVSLGRREAFLALWQVEVYKLHMKIPIDVLVDVFSSSRRRSDFLLWVFIWSVKFSF